MTKSYFTKKDTTWFYISLFYSRNDWGKLINEILSFYQQKKALFNNCIIYLSEEKGEHVQLVLSTKSDNNDLDLIKENTEKHFHLFISENPSDNSKPFKYGEEIWCDYPNNSIAWNRFQYTLADDSLKIDFSQSTSSMMVELMDGDYSLNNTISTAIFMCTKVEKTYSDIYGEKLRIDVIDKALSQLAVDSLNKSFVTEFKLDEKLDIYGISLKDVMGTIDYYWEYKDDYSPVYRQWENEVKRTLYITPLYFLSLNYLIWYHLNIYDTMKVMIFRLLREWCKVNM